MDNYWDDWLNEDEAAVMKRQAQILMQLSELKKEYEWLSNRAKEIKKVRKGDSPISNLIWNDTGEWIYSWVVQWEIYPVKLKDKWEWGTAVRSWDNNLYYRDKDWNIVQSWPMSIVDPTGSNIKSEMYDNPETYAADVKRWADAIIKWNAYANRGGLFNIGRRWEWNGLLNDRSNLNSSLKKLGGTLF